MGIVNLTPYAVVIECEDGTKQYCPPSSEVAMVALRDEIVGSLDGMPVRHGVADGIRRLLDPRALRDFCLFSDISRICKYSAKDDIKITKQLIESGKIFGIVVPPHILPTLQE